MDIQPLIHQLEQNARLIDQVVRGISIDEARWKPSEDAWSVIEVLNHLCDEELLDFRTRLDLVLECPDTPWPPIKPVQWARERDYRERDIDWSLDRFLSLRRQSVQWLKGLQEPDWDRSYVHDLLGKISAGDLLTSWVTHDLLHLRQLSKLKVLYMTEVLSPYSARYAGDL